VEQERPEEHLELYINWDFLHGRQVRLRHQKGGGPSSRLVGRGISCARGTHPYPGSGVCRPCRGQGGCGDSVFSISTALESEHSWIWKYFENVQEVLSGHLAEPGSPAGGIACYEVLEVVSRPLELLRREKRG